MDTHEHQSPKAQNVQTDHPFDTESEGASLSPPSLQLKASDAGHPEDDGGDASGKTLQRKAVDPKAPIQRRVYVDMGGQTVRKENPTGDAALDPMIADNVHRHFTSPQELNDFVGGQTDYLGSLGAGRSWIRLNPNSLLVVGERHSETTMIDLVNAVSTSRYIYEPYNEIPGGRDAEFPNTTAENQTETGELQQRAGQANGENTNHHMEHLFPKVSYALMKIHDWHSNNSWDQHRGNGNAQYSIAERVAFYFGFGLRIAQDVHGQNQVQGANPTASEQALGNAWNANSGLWQAAIVNIDAHDHMGTVAQKHEQGGGTTQQIFDLSRLLMDYFHDDYVATVNPQGGDRTVVDDTQTAMNADNPNYGTMRNNINSWREQYMWRRVQEANNGNYILAGMGDAHRRNMIAQLNNAGIRHTYMDTLMGDADTDAQTREGQAITETQYQAAQNQNNGGGGCCYITTACMVTKGLPDDCHELQVLRGLRDHYIMDMPEGKQLVKLYYDHSPAIVNAINEREDARSIYEYLYGIIQLCVDATMLGNCDIAFQIYCQMVKRLKEQFVPDMDLGEKPFGDN